MTDGYTADFSRFVSDEYAPVKAAKQLRRGKRISEMESLYGRNPADMTAVFRSPEGSMTSPKGKGVETFIPDLTPEFFASAFFRRFQVQRQSLMSEMAVVGV